MDTIAYRVRTLVGHAPTPAALAEISSSVHMSLRELDDAMSGRRGMSLIELAALANHFDSDLHWLISGEMDPERPIVAARHHFDHGTRTRHIPGKASDKQVLEDVALAYRQAYDSPLASLAPGSPSEMRERLGEDFVRPFADRLELRLGIDFIRVAELTTAYSLMVTGRPVIVVPATGNWFRENWDMAHELGHLALGHHDDGLSPEDWTQVEASANAFAAELLLPADRIREVNWENIDLGDLARFVWTSGVSTSALNTRVSALCGITTGPIAYWSNFPTQRLLRAHLVVNLSTSAASRDDITVRMDEASTRRFPRTLQDAHLNRIAAGEVGKETLGWMLGINAELLDVESPALEGIREEDLARVLGF